MDTMIGLNVLDIEYFSRFSWFLEIIFILHRTFTQQLEMACCAFQRAHLWSYTAQLDKKRSADHVILRIASNVGRSTAVAHHYTLWTSCQSSVMVEIIKFSRQVLSSNRLTAAGASRCGRSGATVKTADNGIVIQGLE